MAITIRTTPILCGKDANRFEEQIRKVSKNNFSKTALKEKRAAFDKIMSKSK
ncbi:hypothetical protein [Marinifilum flexuosum]|uniref:hypothetical protein n=1 Tax=Marinifilum flexuosum TaxID=1117708 RepID=UPI00248FAE6E|nr:hypothetical protein [Marinifilum flexuosum]